MSFVLKTLSKAIISEYLYDLVSLDIDMGKEIGAMYGNEPWDKAHFNKDLKNKWVYSQIVLSESGGRPCGFVVASEMLPREIHIHRFAVSPNFRRKGIGSLLINKIFDIAQRYRCKRVTVEVSRLNTEAISFYHKHGFMYLSEDELSRYAARRKHNIQLIVNCTREPDGSEFYILQKVIDVNLENKYELL